MDTFAQWLPPYQHLTSFSRLEMGEVIQQVESSGRLKPARVMRTDGSVGVDASVCDCQIAGYFNGSGIHALFAERFQRSLERINERYGFDLHTEPGKRYPGVCILRYDSDHRGHFRPHVDLGGHPGVDERKLTLVTFLNAPSEYQGGELSIHNGEDLSTRAVAAVGSTVVFPSFSMHSVTPVTEGVRYVAVSWLLGPRIR